MSSSQERIGSRLRLKPWPRRHAEAASEALAQRAAHGDSEAFELLVHRFQRRVYGFAYRYIRDADEAQDLVQEIFLRLYRKLGRFDPRRPFEPWLWRVAANVCANYLDKRVPRPTELNADDDNAATAAPPALLEETRLGAALSRLPPTYRLLLVLHYQADMPLAEIAGTLGVSEMTVKSRLYRARAQLQNALLRQS